MEERTWLRRAIELAEDGMRRQQSGPFGAVVVRDGLVIAEAVNRVTQDADPTAHAEVLAIRRACRSLETHVLRGCVIYSSCEPCPMCLGAIYWARLDRLVFAANRADAAAIGFDDQHIYEELARPSSARGLRTEQALAEEARAMMQGWLEVDPARHY